MKHKIPDEVLAKAVRESKSFSEALRRLDTMVDGGPFKSSYTHFRKRAKDMDLDTSHFKTGAWNKGTTQKKKRTAENVLVLREHGNRQVSRLLTRSLIEIGVPYCCNKCGQGPEWLGHPLTLDVDHINQNWLDDRAENLRFLCPNCHTQFSRGLLTPKVKLKWKPRTPTKSKPCLRCGEQVKDESNKYCSHKCGCASNTSHDWMAIDLIAMVEVESLSYVQLGKRFSVSDNTVKKWYLKQKDLQNKTS